MTDIVDLRALKGNEVSDEVPAALAHRQTRCDPADDVQRMALHPVTFPW